MNKSGIDWCDMSYNPVTGCLHDCEYCYARKITHRFKGGEGTRELHVKKSQQEYDSTYPWDFDPTLHVNRLDLPQRTKTPHTVFVGSMCDLFGEWVPDEWIERVFESCLKAQDHKYLFLTKNPDRYVKLYETGKLIVAENFWYGTTVTRRGDRYFHTNIKGINTFLSIEPLHEDLGELYYNDVMSGEFIKWVILGAETGNRANRIYPYSEWIENIINAYEAANLPLFMKSNLKPYWDGELIQKFPPGFLP